MSKIITNNVETIPCLKNAKNTIKLGTYEAEIFWMPRTCFHNPYVIKIILWDTSIQEEHESSVAEYTAFDSESKPEYFLSRNGKWRGYGASTSIETRESTATTMIQLWLKRESERKILELKEWESLYSFLYNPEKGLSNDKSNVGLLSHRIGEIINYHKRNQLERLYSLNYLYLDTQYIEINFNTTATTQIFGFLPRTYDVSVLCKIEYNPELGVLEIDGSGGKQKALLEALQMYPWFCAN